MNIEEVIEARKIKEVVHFTTHKGLLGSLHSGAVKSRQRLPAADDLKYIYKPNADVRKDLAWLDFVNLSISRINKEFFNHSCRWHRAEDLWWCIMSFDATIIGHPGVYFATTNNMYTGVTRGKGAIALSNLFAPHVTRWGGNIAVRSDELPDSFTTCQQAEVLYPGELSIEHLRRIYVTRDEDADEVHAQLAVVGCDGIDVVVDAERFV